MLEPDLVALHSSRGHQTARSKVFMRASVLFVDLLVFVSGVVALVPALHHVRLRDSSAHVSEVTAHVKGPAPVLLTAVRVGVFITRASV